MWVSSEVPGSSAPPDSVNEKVWTLNELLTAWTLKARDQRELQSLFMSNAHKLNAANLVAMLTQLSWLCKGSTGDGKGQAVHAFAAELVDRLMELLPAPGEEDQDSSPQEHGLAVRELVQAVSALARLG